MGRLPQTLKTIVSVSPRPTLCRQRGHVCVSLGATDILYGMGRSFVVSVSPRLTPCVISSSAFLLQSMLARICLASGSRCTGLLGPSGRQDRTWPSRRVRTSTQLRCSTKLRVSTSFRGGKCTTPARSGRAKHRTPGVREGDAREGQVASAGRGETCTSSAQASRDHSPCRSVGQR